MTGKPVENLLLTAFLHTMLYKKAVIDSIFYIQKQKLISL